MPTTTTIPAITFNAAGNIRSSSSLGASGTANYNVDYSTVVAARIVVANTPGGSVSATRGVRVDIFNRYGTGPTTAATAMLSYTLPSQTASTPEDLTFDLSPGKYNITITNLDTANAVTVEITSATLVITTS